MALKSVLDNLDGVDETLKAHYVEHDGKFHLDLDDTVRDHRDVLSLRKAYDSEKEAAKNAKAEAKKAKDDLTNATKGKPDEAALLAERQQYETQITELTTKLNEAQGKVTGITRDQALNAALTAAGITNPTFIKAATAMLRDKIKMDGDAPTVDGGMGPKPLADFVKGWAAGDEGKAFVTPPSGGGSKGSGDPGPKKLADMSSAERRALHDSNPAQFNALVEAERGA